MPNKDEVAIELARKHYDIEVGLTSVFRIRGSAEAEALPGEPIKLLDECQRTQTAGRILLVGQVPGKSNIRLLT